MAYDPLLGFGPLGTFFKGRGSAKPQKKLAELANFFFIMSLRLNNKKNNRAQPLAVEKSKIFLSLAIPSPS